MAIFKVGEYVALPCRVVEECREKTPCVLVETGSLSLVLVDAGDLRSTHFDRPHLASVEERVEKLARVMCAADGVDPEAKAMEAMPSGEWRARGWVLDGPRINAWRLYARYAQAIINAKLA